MKLRYIFYFQLILLYGFINLLHLSGVMADKNEVCFLALGTHRSSLSEM